MDLYTILFGGFSGTQFLDYICRILVACLCGACIGFERSKRLKEAGIRTHFIVCCAAALMMIISKYGFADLAAGTKEADPARIAAQVVSGISFLGAGVIFRHGSTLKGLTTAAGLWATAGIGLAIGAGMYLLGIFVTAIVAVSQILMHKFTVGGDSITTGHIRFTVRNTPLFKQAFDAYIEKTQLHILETDINYLDGDLVAYDLTFRTDTGIKPEDLHAFLESTGDLQSLQYTAV